MPSLKDLIRSLVKAGSGDALPGDDGIRTRFSGGSLWLRLRTS